MLNEIKTKNLIHKSNIQDIVDMVNLNTKKSAELKQRLMNAATAKAEGKAIDTLTREKLAEELSSVGVTTAKRQEILARYDNAAAAKAEGASVTNLTSTAKIAGAGIKSVGESLLAFVGKHPVVAVLGGIAAAFMAYKKINEWYLKGLQDNADETRETYSSLSSEIDSISDKLTDVRSRIKEISKIKAFLDECGTPEKIELLPYHPMGENKRTALGQDTQVFETPTAEKMKSLTAIFN